MSPQVSENLLMEIYVETDDLYKDFLTWSAQKAIGCIPEFRGDKKGLALGINQ